MRSTTTIISLYFLAPLALCSPIPMVVVGNLEAVSGAAHPPAIVPSSRPRHALPEVIDWNVEEDEAPIDNSPMTPSATAQPSVVLASPRPIPTEYLLSLMYHPWARKKGGGPTMSEPSVEAVAAVEPSSISQMETGMSFDGDEVVPVAVGGMGMPCSHSRLGRVHNDVLAVILIFIFAAVVVVVETYSSAIRFFSKRGVIRLEDAYNHEQPARISVQAEETTEFSEKTLL